MTRASANRMVAYLRRGTILLGHIPQGGDKALTIAIAGFLVTGNWFLSLVIGFGIMLFYYAIATIIGRWDYKHGTYAAQAQIEFEQNPEWNKRWNNIESDISDMDLKIGVYFNDLSKVYEELFKAIQNSIQE